MSEKKVAIVTGANKGLGFAIVKGLCEQFEGEVYLTARDVKRGKEACEELKKLGLNPKFHQLDVTCNESVLNFCNFIKSEHGFIDILINNAGTLFLNDVKASNVFQTEQTMFVNFFSLVDFTEACRPLIRNGGRIINISSSSGHLSRIPGDNLKTKISKPDLSVKELKDLLEGYLEAVKQGRDIEDGWGSSPYVVSKVGVNAYTFMLHRQLKDRGILVNCVHPGYVKTDMTRGAGSVSAEEAAKVPIALALEAAAGGMYFWSNGAIVPWGGPDPRVYIDGRKDV